jgi:hypothetical protein
MFRRADAIDTWLSDAGEASEGPASESSSPAITY